MLALIPGAGAAAPHPAEQSPVSGSDRPTPEIMAQASGTVPQGCRITRMQVGIYQEPNLSGAALGILAAAETVTLGSGSGSGWARIAAPQTGWVQAKFLRGDRNTPCPPGSPVSGPAPVSPPAPGAGTSPMASPPSPTSPIVSGISRAVCQVKPEGGLIVRDEPRLDNSRIIGSIRPGNYTFQFTERRATSPDPAGDRRWAYITAPAKGWISPGFVAGGSNLTGEGCG